MKYEYKLIKFSVPNDDNEDKIFFEELNALGAKRWLAVSTFVRENFGCKNQLCEAIFAREVE